MKVDQFVFVFSCLFVMACLLRAQEITGNLEGRIIDLNGIAIDEVSIVVSSNSLQGTRGAISDNNGLFRLQYLPPGDYTVRISHASFRPQVYVNVQILLGKTTGLGDIRMTEMTYDMKEIVIQGDRSLLDPGSATTGANILRRDFELLPIERNYRSVISILPHTNQSYFGDEVNMAGASGAENRYFIDGTDVSDSYRGMGGTNLPYNFVQEIQVKSGGYEPEYRSSLGGIVNAITYSGSNEFSGQVFGFFTNNNFSSEHRLAETEPPKGSYSQYDFGFLLGGPILRDKLWFSAAYSPFFRNEDVKLPGLGYYPDNIIAHPFAGKLNWKVSESLDFRLTVLGDPTHDNAVGKKFWYHPTILYSENPDFFLSKNISGGYGSIIDGQYFLSNKTLLQGTVSWKTFDNKYLPRTEKGTHDPTFLDTETVTVSGGTGESVEIRSSVLTVSMSASLNLEQHLLKAGIEYKDIGVESKNTAEQLWRFNDSSYAFYEFNLSGTLRNQIPSFYMQDSWSFSDRITITGGIRWDGLFIIGADGKVAQRILRQFQPRLGGSVLLNKEKTMKIFASAGRYAEDLLMFGSTLYHLGGTQIVRYYNHDPRMDPTVDDSLFFGGTIAPAVKDLRGQFYDELTIGYEQLLTPRLKFTARGIYRTLREILEDGEGIAGTGNYYFANPGHPPLDDFPNPKRDYVALDFTVETSFNSISKILLSYVLSRNYGNYAGMYWQDFGVAMPSATGQFDFLDIMKNTTGLLPNDRTHVLKFNGSYNFKFGLSCGVSFIWQSGTPLSEVGGSVHGQDWPIFLKPRGSIGRLPSIWDLNLRFAYDITYLTGWKVSPRLILDIFHLGSQLTVVQQDQRHFFNQNEQGEQINPNPAYGLPQKFQPPTSVRIGMEVSF